MDVSKDSGAKSRKIPSGDSHTNSTATPKRKLLIIAVPSEDSFIKYAVNGMLNMPPHHISRFSDKCLQNLADIFGVELLEIYHESVQNEHISFYKSVIWAQKFLAPRLIDRGLTRKIINKIGRFGGWNLIKIPPNALGHTVVAVYSV